MVNNPTVTVGTTPTPVVDARSGATSSVCELVKNPSSTVTVYVGGDDVTTTSGYPLGPGASMKITAKSGECVYAIVAAGTQSLTVLRGVN